jgi:hypothetical protein
VISEVSSIDPVVQRWKCVGYCRHCTAHEDDSTFRKEWGHFEKSDEGAWVRADSALAEIERLTRELQEWKDGNTAADLRLSQRIEECERLREGLEILAESSGPHVDYAYLARETLEGRDWRKDPIGSRRLANETSGEHR